MFSFTNLKHLSNNYKTAHKYIIFFPDVNRLFEKNVLFNNIFTDLDNYRL